MPGHSTLIGFVRSKWRKHKSIETKQTAAFPLQRYIENEWDQNNWIVAYASQKSEHILYHEKRMLKRSFLIEFQRFRFFWCDNGGSLLSTETRNETETKKTRTIHGQTTINSYPLQSTSRQESSQVLKKKHCEVRSCDSHSIWGCLWLAALRKLNTNCLQTTLWMEESNYTPVLNAIGSLLNVIDMMARRSNFEL